VERYLGRPRRVKRSTVFKKQFSEVEDACALAQAIVDTVREPLIVLDKDLRAIAASRRAAASPRFSRPWVDGNATLFVHTL
jgi:PAS domain-containing protein